MAEMPWMNLQVIVSRTPPRHYDVALLYDSALSGWVLPAGAINVVIYANGLRYHQGADFMIAAGIVKNLSHNMSPEYLITCDYDLPQ